MAVLTRRSLRDGLLALLGLGALGAAAWLMLWRSEVPRQSLTITAGSASGLRHSFAVALARESRDYGLDFDLVPTAGSEQALEDVEAGRIQVALIQGGLATGNRVNVRQVAAMHVEP